MKILIFSASYSPVLGGLQTVVQNLAQQLLRESHQVQVVTTRYPRQLPRQEHINGVTVTRMFFMQPNMEYIRRKRPDLALASLYTYQATLRDLSQLMRRYQPEVINVHFPDQQIPFVLWLRRQFRFRLVVSLHGHEVLRWHDGSSADGPHMLRRILREANAVTACSQCLLDHATALEPAISGKGHVIYNGIDLKRFADQSRYRHPRPYILAYGRLIPKKGFALLLEAFAQIATRYPEHDLLLAGEGEQRVELEQLSSQLGLAERVHFYGRASQTELVHLLNACTLLVVPSREEPFGIVALEGMAAGKPVLATRVGGLPELLPSPPNRLVEPTIEGLVGGLHSFLNETANNTVLAQINRELAQNYSWEQVTQKYMASYMQATAAP
ncbi:MAG: glycosyltransferase family 4 protein [Oscillochloridaceae bacterium umkhey_bin13]